MKNTSPAQETEAMADSTNIENLNTINIINVLSSEYNAVYYCNEDTHDYEILFQQGFVKAQLVQMKQMCPKYEDGFRFFIKMLVHPEDRENMERELSFVPERLQHQKSVRIEFRRMYGEGVYLYTEMYVVKIGEAQDELHEFVAGFRENDKQYRTAIDQQRQLEYVVAERTAELRNRNRALARINEDIVELIGNITEARDMESGEHIRRVKGFTNILANRMMKDWPEYGITGDMVELMTSASALHDIGKISIPDAILLKPGKLTAEEFEIMKTHCEKGCDILRNAPKDWSSSYLKVSLDICHYHHERYDGKGYPAGLAGDNIPIAAQIVSVADCFDALTSERPYKKAFDMKKAYEMILDGECGAFSDKILASFSACRDDMFGHALNSREKYGSSLPAGISTASLSWMKLLFVDDNEINREIGEEILREEGAEVTVAAGGREALEIFESSEPGYFDAILMDVVMPEMDGMEATRQIRRLEREDAGIIPIIALTSLTSDANVDQCLDAGMNSFITKPIALSALNKVLYECVKSTSEALNSAVHMADAEARERIDRAINREVYLTGITAGYAFMCYVNGNTNDVLGFRCNRDFEKALNNISPQLPPNRRLDRLFAAMVPSKDFLNFIEDVDRDKITSYLKNKSIYHAFVPIIIEGKEVLHRLKVVPDDEKQGCYIISLQSVDDEMVSEIRSRQLIQIFADSYIMVDYIDLEKNKFSRYQGSGTGNAAEKESSGSFTEEAGRYISSFVHPEDRELMSAFLNIKNIRSKLSSGSKSISARFRSMKTGEPRYMEVRLTNTGDLLNVRYVIMTISDIDEMVRREMENSRLLEDTRMQMAATERRANRDPLTGVNNVTAYTDAISNLSEELLKDRDISFAVVFCDVDNLKEVNDTYDHSTGDMYIKNCCRIISNVFSESPVFRIGGDEFVVLLHGADYEKRDELIRNISAELKKAGKIEDYRAGRASFSFGVAAYDREKDSNVASVVKRADEKMYENKHLNKKA